MGYVAGAAALLSVGSGMMEADSQRRQAHEQQDSVREQNLINLAQYIASRGGDPAPILASLSGSKYGAIGDALKTSGTILPGYAGQGTEKGLLDSALAASAVAGGNPTQDLVNYQQIVDSQMPAVAQGNTLVSDVFSGQMLDDRLADLQPVLKARFGLSDAEAQAVEAGLREQLSRVSASDAAKGFTGGGSVLNNQMLAATIGARNQIAVDRANAELENAKAIQALQESNRDLQLKSLDVPINRASQLIRLSEAPRDAVVENQIVAQKPLAFFRLNPGNPPEGRAAIAPSTPSMGGVILSGAAQGVADYNNARLKSKQADAYNERTQAIADASRTGNGTDWGGM